MRMSEWLRQWQISGEVPESGGESPELAFWAGWLFGSTGPRVATGMDERREMAIKCAEFIESRARE